MKCLKNTKTGNIIRVDEKQAFQMAGNTWKYTTKSEWRGVVSETPKETTEVGHDQGGSYEIKKEKKSKKVSK
jgi:hypothetical protein